MAINRISVAAYLTEDEYEHIPDSTYNDTRRFLAAALFCGVTFFLNLLMLDSS